MCRLFSLPLGQAVRPDIYLKLVVDEAQPRAEQLVHCLTTGSAACEDTLRLRVGEQVKTVRFQSVVLADATNRPAYVLGVVLDVSALQRLEAETYA